MPFANGHAPTDVSALQFEKDCLRLLPRFSSKRAAMALSLTRIICPTTLRDLKSMTLYVL